MVAWCAACACVYVCMGAGCRSASQPFADLAKRCVTLLCVVVVLVYVVCLGLCAVPVPVLVSLSLPLPLPLPPLLSPCARHTVSNHDAVPPALVDQPLDQHSPPHPVRLAGAPGPSGVSAMLLKRVTPPRSTAVGSGSICNPRRRRWRISDKKLEGSDKAC